MTNSKIFIVGGLQVLNTRIADYNHDLQEYQYRCQAIRDSYIQKTSTVKTTAGNIKNYENWYMVLPNGGLKSVGKDEPNYEDLYPTMPLKPPTPQHEQVTGLINRDNIIISADKFKVFKKDFKKCFCFPINSRVK